MTSNNQETPNQNASEPTPAILQDFDCSDGLSNEHFIIIKQAKLTIGRMLRYAIANPDIIVADELISMAVQTLCLAPKNFTSQDEVNLWKVYADLSKIIKPASDISIQIADGLKDMVISKGRDVVQGGNIEIMPLKPNLFHWFGFDASITKSSVGSDSSMNKLVNRCNKDLRIINLCLIFLVVLYIAVQCYNALLSDVLTNSAQQIADLKVQQASELLINDLTSGAQKVQMEEAKLVLKMQLSATSQTLIDLTKPLINNPFLKLSTSTNEAFKGCRTNSLPEQSVDKLTSCIALEREYALSANTVFSRYILPLLLGFIGATAYVTRLALYRLTTNSYIPSPRGMLSMRLCLGGLLGAISGIFISSGAIEIKGFSVSLTLTALLMGYSVEVAFSLFDSAIERLKDWTRGLRTSDGKDSIDMTKSDVSKTQTDASKTQT